MVIDIKKEILTKFIHYYFNKFRVEDLENFYGKDTTIKVHTINESVKNRQLLIEIIVYLKSDIVEDILDTSLIDLILNDALRFFGITHNIVSLVRWEV